MYETLDLEESVVQSIRVLLVEDDVELANAITEYLAKQGIIVFVEARGDRAPARISEIKPDLVILDVMLPGKGGFNVCRELRDSGSNVPVIILAAKEEDFDQLPGLELGAEDYLAKPVQPRVLLARIKAITRRMHANAASNTEGALLQFGRLRLHGINREVTLSERRIELSPAEFDLLWLLATNAGKVMQRNEILKSLRGLNYSGADRSIDARLYRLRRRFGVDKEASWKIKTVRPHGYMFCQEPW